jgi:capsule polysaccharide export protein KpsE/RkpR
MVALLDARISLDFDIEAAFCELEMVLGEDDPDIERLKARVLARHQQLKSQVLALASAKAAA